MNVKLIFPPVASAPYFNASYESKVLCLPHGLGILVSYLRDNNCTVDVDDINARMKSPYSSHFSPEKTRATFQFHENQKRAGYYNGIADKRSNKYAETLLALSDVRGYDIVGIGINSPLQALTAFVLLEKIKRDYNIPVVIGGPYVTAYAELILKDYSFVDYAIVGAGEEPFLELIHALQGRRTKNNVSSLWFRERAEVTFTGRTFYNIEDQYCPDYDGFQLNLYERNITPKEKTVPIPYSLSRGCGYCCRFCIYSRIDGPWQAKSVQKVIKDVRLLQEKYNAKFFLFEDTTFNMSNDYVDTICNAFIKNKISVQWEARARAQNIDRRILSKMKVAGCRLIKWGIESGSDTMLQLMEKDTTSEEEVAVLKMASEVGLRNGVFLIIGYPYETEQDLKKTALLLKNNAAYIHRAIIYGLSIQYGSFLFYNAKDSKIELKRLKSTFFSYKYSYKETKRHLMTHERKALERQRKRIVDYGYRYILCKSLRFPYNLLSKVLGTQFIKICSMLDKKLRIKPMWFHKKSI